MTNDPYGVQPRSGALAAAITEVKQGDEVVLIGRQGDDRITAEEVAERLGTINYEVVSAILARVPRETLA